MPRLIDADALKKEWHLGNVCETFAKRAVGIQDNVGTITVLVGWTYAE